MGQVESTVHCGKNGEESITEIETEFGDFDFIPSIYGKKAQNLWTFKEALSKFSNSLIPSPPIVRGGNEAVQKVFEILKKNRSDVSRLVIGGSSGEWITSQPQIEAFVFLNCQKILDQIQNGRQNNSCVGLEEPPFRKILTEFGDILRKTVLKKDDMKILTSYQPSQYISVQVSGHRIDLWPTLNVKPDSRNIDLADEQGTKILDLIGKSGQQLRASNFLNPGLVESSLNYVKGQTPFAHAVVRLAKFWDGQLYLDQKNFVPSRHYLMEVLAIFAANSVASNNISEAIELFLERMSSLGSLRIVGDNWRSSRDPQVRSIVKRWMNKPTPVVLDPVNPYNNLTWFQQSGGGAVGDEIMTTTTTKKKKSDIVHLFEEHAKKSLAKLRALEWPGKRHCSFENVANIFGDDHKEMNQLTDDVMTDDWQLVPQSGVER